MSGETPEKERKKKVRAISFFFWLHFFKRNPMERFILNTLPCVFPSKIHTHTGQLKRGAHLFHPNSSIVPTPSPHQLCLLQLNTQKIFFFPPLSINCPYTHTHLLWHYIVAAFYAFFLFSCRKWFDLTFVTSLLPSRVRLYKSSHYQV